MKLLIDADSLIYKAACPCEYKEYVLFVDNKWVMQFQYKKDMLEFAEDMPESWGDFEYTHELITLEPVLNALHSLKIKIEAIIEETGCDEYHLYLTKGRNFRHDLATIAPYKGQRPEKPVHHKACFDYLMNTWGAVYAEGLEADDVVAMEQTADTCIAHIDKDIDTVAGRHFNYDTFEFYDVTYEEGLCNYYRQFLVGDTSDNIKGVHGIGKVKASKIITSDMPELEMFNQIKLYFNHDLDTILETGRLLHMTRELHDDGSPVLWEFPE